MCDCDPPQAFFSTLRKARTPHICFECGAEIQPGETYEYVSGVWEHRGASMHTCMVCAELRQAVKDSTEVRDWPCFGELYEIVCEADL